MGNLRHRIVWKILRFPVYAFLKIKLNYSCKQAGTMPAPFILVSNHVTDLDPLMVGCSFRQQMYFVASEHLFRKGWVSKLLVWLVAPIARIKGTTDTVSAMNIIRALKRKMNVGLFAEGDKSWNGTTNPLHPTTARLIKASKAALVTYRLKGGYLSSPRWSTHFRRGKMFGAVVNVYHPTQLNQMTDEELTAAISRDIAEDAFETQRQDPVAFCGKRLAEHLEMTLYACPACRQIASTHSHDNVFSCDCGLTVTYNKFGFFEGENRPFDTIADWDAWQTSFMSSYLNDAGDGPILMDRGQQLYTIGSDHSESLVAEGTLALFKDRFVLGDFSISLDKLYQMGVYGAGSIVFSAEGVNYEIKSSILRSGRKYLTCYLLLSSNTTMGVHRTATV